MSELEGEEASPAADVPVKKRMSESNEKDSERERETGMNA